jgi:nicotinamide-nucleotide amidase
MTAATRDIAVRVRTLATLLTRRRCKMATVESCTGGLIASALTALAGSSVWFDRGWVTYSNAAKTEEIGVASSLITDQGAVSEAVAAAMARGARATANVDYALSVTGIAGPDGGSPQKPVGTVCFGWATPTRLHTETRHFTGDRQSIREQSVDYALAQLIALLIDESL